MAVWFALRERRSAADARTVGARYEALAGHLPDVSVLVYDLDLRILLLEGGAVQAHGWRREEFEGRTLPDVVPRRAARGAAHALPRRARRRVLLP